MPKGPGNNQTGYVWIRGTSLIVAASLHEKLHEKGTRLSHLRPGKGNSTSKTLRRVCNGQGGGRRMFKHIPKWTPMAVFVVVSF